MVASSSLRAAIVSRPASLNTLMPALSGMRADRVSCAGLDTNVRPRYESIISTPLATASAPGRESRS